MDYPAAAFERVKKELAGQGEGGSLNKALGPSLAPALFIDSTNKYRLDAPLFQAGCRKLRLPQSTDCEMYVSVGMTSDK